MIGHFFAVKICQLLLPTSHLPRLFSSLWNRATERLSGREGRNLEAAGWLATGLATLSEFGAKLTSSDFLVTFAQLTIVWGRGQGRGWGGRSTSSSRRRQSQTGTWSSNSTNQSINQSVILCALLSWPARDACHIRDTDRRYADETTYHNHRVAEWTSWETSSEGQTRLPEASTQLSTEPAPIRTLPWPGQWWELIRCNVPYVYASASAAIATTTIE